MGTEQAENVRYEIQLSVLRAKEMNVYLYGGNSRFNATIPLVKDNAAVETGKTYTIDSNEGMLLVAYPNHEVDTEFEFVYELVPKIIETTPEVVEEPVVVVPEEEEEQPVVVTEEEEPTVVEEEEQAPVIENEEFDEEDNVEEVTVLIPEQDEDTTTITIVNADGIIGEEPKYKEEVDGIYHMGLIYLFASLFIISVLVFCGCKKKTSDLNKILNRKSTKANKKANVIDMEKGDVTAKNEAGQFDIYEGQTGNKVSPNNKDFELEK